MRDYKKYFSRAIEANYGTDSNRIISEIDAHYLEISKDTEFALKSKNPIDRRLDFCAYFLALIKTLDKRNEAFEKIRKICLEITIAYVQPKNRLHRYIKRLLPKLTLTWVGQILIKILAKKTSKNANEEGFIAKIITDKNATFGLGYGIDILECGICKLFNKHDYKKYSSILCEVDEVTSGLAGLKLIRTGTIANGATKCDFRFKREN